MIKKEGKNLGNYFLFSLYVLLSITTMYGSGLFIWWWWKNNWNASNVYIYITLLFISMAFRNALDAVAFYDRVLDNYPDTWIYDHWMWPVRIIGLLMANSLIVGHMSYRAFVQRRKGQGLFESKEK